MLLVRGLLVSVASIVFIGALLFVPAGTMQWPAGWVFLVLILAWSVVQMVDLNRTSPTLLQQRLSPQNAALYGYLVFVVWAVLMPLDAMRFHWSHVPLAVQIVGGAVLTASFPLIVLTFRENAFAVPEVRVQAEQKVISTGLYGHVRHPLYGAAVFFMIGTPLLLGSWYGLLGAAVFIGFLAFRAVGEERLLRAELPGYPEYMAKVKYRFIPYIW